jgi:predicted RNA binding protein YcfA (HicA-like mRNA interferase family)
VPRIPGIRQQDAVRVFEKIGFRIARQSKHIIMTRSGVRLTVPRHRTIDALTMGGIAKAAGLTPEEFRALL